jgi:hypothetical protein
MLSCLDGFARCDTEDIDGVAAEHVSPPIGRHDPLQHVGHGVRSAIADNQVHTDHLQWRHEGH